MATVGGQQSPALNQVIGEQFGRFDVFQLVRLLLHRSGAGRREQPWSIDLRLRFRADLRAVFPGHEVTRLRRGKAMPDFRLERRGLRTRPQCIELHTPNYCLASELGSLPEPFLEWVRDQERIGGRAMAAFLDVFNQRIHVLRHALKHDALRALDPALPEETRYAGRLASLTGMALPSQQRQVPLAMRRWLGLAGLLADTRKSAALVCRVLSAFLGVDCRLESLVGRWRDIEPRDRLALGRRRNVLGRNSLLGCRTWDARAAVRLHIACLPFRECLKLLPLRPARAGEVVPDAAHAGLVAMVHLLLDRRFDCEVAIEIDAGTLPPARLSLPWLSGGVGLRLGQTAWLGRGRGRDRNPIVSFQIDAYPPVEAA